MIYLLLRPVVDFQPLITRTEVLKVSVTHYFKPDKARRELEYVSKIKSREGMERVIENLKGSANAQGKKHIALSDFADLPPSSRDSAVFFSVLKEESK
jgi:hypothetical protein